MSRYRGYDSWLIWFWVVLVWVVDWLLVHFLGGHFGGAWMFNLGGLL